MKDIYLLLFIISCLYQILYAKKIYGYFFNQIFLFNVIFFLHNWSFSLSRIFFDDLKWYTPNNGDLYDDQLLLINLSSLWAFFLATILYKAKRIVKLYSFFDFKIYSYLFFITSFLSLIQGISTQSSIYGSEQAIDSSSSFSPLGILLFSHSIFGSLILINAKNKKLLFLIIFIEFAIAILTGTRKALVIILFTFLISKFEFIKVSFNLKKFIISALLISFLFYITIFLALYRENFGSSIGFKEKVVFTNKVLINNWDKFFISTLNSANSEAVQTWALELLDKGQMKPTYGLSYLQGIVNTIILRPYQGDLVNYQAAYYFKQIAYPNVQNQGYDFSFTAEGMLNWKNFAFISYFVLGIIITKVNNKRITSNYYNSLYIIIMALLYVVLRTDSTSFFRYLSYFVFSFYIFRSLRLITLKKIRLTGNEIVTNQ